MSEDMRAWVAALPEVPVVPISEDYRPYTHWVPPLSVTTFASARRFGAISAKRLGPRGGRWYRGIPALWAEWREVYLRRVKVRREGMQRRDAMRRLGAPPPRQR